MQYVATAKPLNSKLQVRDKLLFGVKYNKIID